MAFKLSSAVFTDGGEIPSKYTCEGADVSAPLQWEGVPEGARSLVLIVDDPDAPDPDAPKMTWVHWVLYNIPPYAGGLPEGVTSAYLPTGTREGVNDWKRSGYGGPCPPVGRHRYFYKLYALDTVLNLDSGESKDSLLQALEGHILAQAELMGTYTRE